MENKLWEIQDLINKNTNAQILGLIEQIKLLVSIIEDHEKDMEKMAAELNELKQKFYEEQGA